MSNLINNLGGASQIGQPSYIRKDSSPNRHPELTTATVPTPQERPGSHTVQRLDPVSKRRNRGALTLAKPIRPNEAKLRSAGLAETCGFHRQPRASGRPQERDQPPSRRFRQTKPSLKQENELIPIDINNLNSLRKEARAITASHAAPNAG